YGLHEFERSILFEDHNGVNSAQSSEHLCAAVLIVQRPIRTLALPAHAFVAVEADHQPVAERRRFFQVFHVTAVKNIEATIGEHDPIAFHAPDVRHALHVDKVQYALVGCGCGKFGHASAGLRLREIKSSDMPPSTMIIAVCAVHNNQPMANASARMMPPVSGAGI